MPVSQCPLSESFVTSAKERLKLAIKQLGCGTHAAIAHEAILSMESQLDANHLFLGHCTLRMCAHVIGICDLSVALTQRGCHQLTIGI